MYIHVLYTCMLVYIYMYVYTNIYTFIYICIHIRLYIHQSIRAHIVNLVLYINICLFCGIYIINMYLYV